MRSTNSVQIQKTYRWKIRTGQTGYLLNDRKTQYTRALGYIPTDSKEVTFSSSDFSADGTLIATFAVPLILLRKLSSHSVALLWRYASHTRCYQRGSLCQNPGCNRTTRRPDHRKEMQTEVVWTCLPFTRSGKTILQSTAKWGRRKGGQKKRLEDDTREWTRLEFAKSKKAVKIREK